MWFSSSLQHVKLLLSCFHKYSMPILTDWFYHLGALFAFSNEAVEFLRYFVVKLQLSWKAAYTAMPYSLYKSLYKNLGVDHSLMLLFSHTLKILCDTMHRIRLCKQTTVSIPRFNREQAMVILFLHSLSWASFCLMPTYIFSGPFILFYTEEHYQTGKVVKIGKIYICPISINKYVDCIQ